MAFSSFPVPKDAPDPHHRLKRAHHEAAMLARLLKEGLAPVYEIDLTDARRKATQVGDALLRIATAERACGHCAGKDHIFAKQYQQMLKHHRLAYLGFERLSSTLEGNRLTRSIDVATLAADLEHHLNTAETAHQASLLSVNLQKAQ